MVSDPQMRWKSQVQKFSLRSKVSKPNIKFHSLGILHGEDWAPEVRLWKPAGLPSWRAGGLQETENLLLNARAKSHRLQVPAKGQDFKMILSETHLLILKSLLERQEGVRGSPWRWRCWKQTFWGSHFIVSTRALASTIWESSLQPIRPGAFLAHQWTHSNHKPQPTGVSLLMCSPTVSAPPQQKCTHSSGKKHA